MSSGPKFWAANCFHYNLINTSKRIDTNSAISNMLFDMPQPRESCVWVLKTGRVIVKENTQKFPGMLVLLASLVCLSFDGIRDQALRESLRKKGPEKGKGKQ